MDAAKKIAREVASLPPEAQQQIVDFVAFLKARNCPAPPAKKKKRSKLMADPFIGMWQDRKDMKDSSAWVRKLRQRQWERRK